MNTPSTDLEKTIAMLVAEIKVNTGMNQDEISRRLGFGPRYISTQKSKRLLRRMAADDLQNLAAMAGKKMTFI